MKIKRSFINSMVFLCSSLLLSSTLCAGRVPLPPIEDAFNQRNRVASFQIVERIDSETYAVVMQELLWGERDEITRLKVSSRSGIELVIDKSYIIVYSKLRRHPIFRDEFQANPDGPTVIRLPFTDYAVFEDSSLLREIFRQFQLPVHHQADPRKLINQRVQLLFDLVEASKQQQHGSALKLALIELSQHHEWLASNDLKRRQFRQYKKLVKARDVNDELQEHLVAAVSFFPPEKRGNWIASHCRKIISETGPGYELTSYRPLLVKTCVKRLIDAGRASDSKLVGQLLRSNAPGVVKVSIQAMIQFAPDELPLLAQHALDRPGSRHSEITRILSALLE